MSASNKIAVISVSPLLTVAIQKALSRRNATYPIYEANLDEAVAIAKRCEETGVEVIISRGRTATYLRERVSATIVNIRTSYFTYAVAVKSLQQKGARRIAILGFSDQFHYIASKYDNLWGADVVFRAFEWRGKSELDMLREFAVELQKLKSDGFEGVIGNHTVREVAESLGFSTSAHLPDTDMIETALDEAEYVASSLSAHEEKSQTVSAFLNAVSEILVKINQNGVITDYNAAAEALFGPSLQQSASIVSLFPSLDWDEFSSQKLELHEKVFPTGNQNLIVDLVPIFIDTVFSGAILTAQKVAQIQKLEQTIRSKIIQKGLVAKSTFRDILGGSEQIQDAVHWAKRIAQSDGTVLISGDTGTGKEIFAQSIHNYSARARAPFVAINCAALSPSVLESELFGYVRGAFTGALSEGKQGIFELAHTGTIFLDEIGELPVDIQAKLLRVIQEKEIVRIGDNRVIPVNVRIIAATNRDLEEEVRQKRFRVDLYYRLCVLTLTLPTLNERRGDIRILAQHFLSQINASRRFSPAALDILEGMSWPGNIRQLRNIVDRVNVFSDHNVIEDADMQRLLLRNHQPADVPRPAPRERDMAAQIREALLAAGGNRAQAAESLGISTVTLWRRIKRIRQLNPTFLHQIESDPSLSIPT